jgi:GGDEF domain-containing protein
MNRFRPYDISVQELIEEYLNEPMAGYGRNLMREPEEGDVSAQMGSQQAVNSYIEALRKENERKAAIMNKPTYKESKQMYRQMAEDMPEAVQQTQKEQWKPVQTVENIAMAGLAGPFGLGAMAAVGWGPEILEALNLPELADYVRAARRFTTPTGAMGMVATGVEHQLGKGPLKSFEAELALTGASEAARGYMGTPSALLLGIPKAIAGEESKVGEVLGKIERESGITPQAKEIALRRQLPQTEVAAQLGRIGGEIGFALGVQMPMMRQIPALGKVAQPMASLLSKSKVPWIAANAARIAGNMTMRSFANMTRRAIQELPAVITGTKKVPDYLWGIGLTGAFTASEVLPEVIPNPVANIFTQTFQGAANNAIQDLLEGKEVTNETLVSGALMNFFYALDDAGRVKGYSEVQARIDPWLKNDKISPEEKIDGVASVLYKASQEGKIQPADVPVILKMAGAREIVANMDSKSAEAVVRKIIEPKTTPPKSYREALPGIQEELGLKGNQEAFEYLRKQKDYKGNTYEAVWRTFAKEGRDPETMAMYYRASEFYKTQSEKKAVLAKVEGPGVKDEPGNEPWRGPAIQVKKDYSYNDDKGNLKVYATGMSSSNKEMLDYFDRLRTDARQKGEEPVVMVIDFDGVGAANSKLDHPTVNQRLWIPILKEIESEFGSNAFLPMGDEVYIYLPTDGDLETMLGKIKKINEFVDQQEADGVKLGMTVALMNDPKKALPVLNFAKPKPQDVSEARPDLRGNLIVPKDFKIPLDSRENLTRIIKEGEYNVVKFSEIRRAKRPEDISGQVQRLASTAGRGGGERQIPERQGLVRPGATYSETELGGRREAYQKPRRPSTISPAELKQLPLKKLPSVTKSITAKSLEYAQNRFAAVGWGKFFGELANEVRQTAEGLGLRTAAQRQKVQQMVMVELSKSVISYKKGGYSAKFDEGEVGRIADVLVRRDADIVKSQYLKSEESRTEKKAQKLEDRGLRLMAKLTRDGIKLMPFFEPTGEPKITEDYLAIPSRFRAAPYNKLNDFILKRNQAGNYIIPKKYWAKPGTRSNLDETAEGLYKGARVGDRYEESYISEPRGDVLIDELLNEVRASTEKKTVEEEEEKYYQNAREEHEDTEARELTKVYQLIKEGKAEEAVKYLEESGLGWRIADLAGKKQSSEVIEDIFEGTTKPYRKRPKQADLRIEGKGEAKETERMKAMQDAGQLTLEGGAQKGMFPTQEQTVPITQKKYDGKVLAERIAHYKNQGFPTKKAFDKAMADAVRAWVTGRVKTESGNWPSEKVQQKAKAAAEMLGVPPENVPAFLVRYGTLLRSAAERYSDVNDIVKELQTWGVETKPELPRAPMQLPGEKRQVSMLDAQSSTRLKTEVNGLARASALTEQGEIFDETAKITVQENEVSRIPEEAKSGVVIENSYQDALRAGIKQQLEQIADFGLPEAVVKDRVRLDARMQNLRTKFNKGKGEFSVASINIGRLGDINDRTTWEQGSAYINKILETVRSNLPKGSQAGRYSPRGGEFLAVIPLREELARVSISQAIKQIESEIKSPDGEVPELHVGVAGNKGEPGTETIAEATIYGRDAKKLGKGLVVTRDLHEKYQNYLQEPKVRYRPEAVGQSLNIESKLSEDGYVNVPDLEIKTPLDVAEIGRAITDPSKEKLVVVGVSKDGIVQAVSIAALGDAEKIPMTKWQRLSIFQPLLLGGSEEFYIVHNHTGGDPKPTESDLKQYEFLRTMSAHFGLKFRGGLSLAKNQYAFVKPSGLGTDVEVKDMPEAAGQDVFRLPVLAAGLETGKATQITEVDMPAYLAKHLQAPDPKAVHIIPFRPDGTPAGIFQVSKGFDDPHHIAAEIAKLGAVTFSPRVVIISGESPETWKNNLSILNHDLESMYGIKLEDVVDNEGKTFRAFDPELPIATKIGEAIQDAPYLKTPVSNYKTLANESNNSKSQAVGDVINKIVHYVVNPEDILQRWWTNIVDKNDLTSKWRQGFQKILEKTPGGKTLLRAFSTTAGRPGEYLDAREFFNKAISQWADIAVETSSLLHRGWKPEEKKMMLQALRGEIELKREMNPKMWDAVENARNLLVKAGYLAAEVSERTGLDLLSWDTFLKNFGTYVPRLYKFYEAKGWTPEEWRRNIARSWLMENGKIVKEIEGEPTEIRGMTEEEANETIGQILAKQPISIWVAGRKGPRAVKLDLGRFKAKKNVPPALRVLLGEIKEPSYLVGRGLVDVSKDAFTADFFERIAHDSRVAISPEEWALLSPREQKEFKQVPSGSLLGENAKGRTANIAKQIDDIDKSGQLGGMYLKKPVYDDVIGVIEWQGEASKTAKRLLGLYKSFKVTLNPPAFFRNLVTNFMFAEMFGDLPVLRIDNYVDAARRMVKKDSEYKEARDEGLFRTTFAHSELLPFLDGIKGARSIKEFKNRLQEVLAKTGETVFKGATKASEFYGTIEDYFKFAVYLYQKKRFHKTSSEAAKIAQNSLFNYSDVTPFIRKVRSSWWGNPFVTFQTKWIPQFTRAVVRKPLTVVKWLALPSIITALSRKKHGVDEEEYKKMKNQLSPWMRNNPFYVLLPWKDKHGRYMWFDATFHFPWGDIVDRGGIGYALGSLTGGNPFYSAIVMAQKFSTALANKRPPIDDYFGKEIWDETDPPEKQLARAAQYVMRSLGPSWLPGGYSYEKMYRGLSDTPDYWGRQWTPGQGIAYQFGMKVSPVDIEEATRGKLFEYDTKIREHESELSSLNSKFYQMTGVPVKTVTDEGLLTRSAKKVYREYLRQEELLLELLSTVSDEYGFEITLDHDDVKRLGSRMNQMSDLQINSYALKSKIRKEVGRLDAILKERYPSSVPSVKEQLKELE